MSDFLSIQSVDLPPRLSKSESKLKRQNGSRFLYVEGLESSPINNESQNFTSASEMDSKNDTEIVPDTTPNDNSIVKQLGDDSHEDGLIKSLKIEDDEGFKWKETEDMKPVNISHQALLKSPPPPIRPVDPWAKNARELFINYEDGESLLEKEAMNAPSFGLMRTISELSPLGVENSPQPPAAKHFKLNHISTFNSAPKLSEDSSLTRVEVPIRSCCSEPASAQNQFWPIDDKVVRSESMNFEALSENNSNSPRGSSPWSSSSTLYNKSTSFKYTPRALSLIFSLRSYYKVEGKKSSSGGILNLRPPTLSTKQSSYDSSSQNSSPTNHTNNLQRHTVNLFAETAVASNNSARSFSMEAPLTSTTSKSDEAYHSTRSSIRAKSISPTARRNNDAPLEPCTARSLGGGRNSHFSRRPRSAISGLIGDEIKLKATNMQMEKIRCEGIHKFNLNAKDGLRFLIENNFIQDSPDSVSNFLFYENGLSKRKMGEYFGRNTSFNQKVFEHFLGCLDFKMLTIDEALRRMVVKFRMPGEAQQIDRIMEQFAKRWFVDNDGGGFSCVDTAYILAFSLMMLNTDMYNRNLKETEKMNVEQFILNNRAIDQGKDLPRELLVGMYNRIQDREIRMDECDMYESEDPAFAAPKLSGWLKKKVNNVFVGWKRHWFVLVNGVLYYFFAPHDTTPRCIIPLELITVAALGQTDLMILAHERGYVKSVKVLEDGGMQQGSHREFILRAEKRSDRDKWVKELRKEVINPFMSPRASVQSSPARIIKKLTPSRHIPTKSSTPQSLPTPILRGWARTQNEGNGSWTRRYCAIFKNIETDISSLGLLSKTSSFVDTQITGTGTVMSTPRSETEEGPFNFEQPKQNILYFYGSSEMCDRMISQNSHTSHGAVVLNDVTNIIIQKMISSGVFLKGIILYCLISDTTNSKMIRSVSNLSLGDSFGSRRWVIVPEEKPEEWVKALINSCPLIEIPYTKDEPMQVDIDEIFLTCNSPSHMKSPSSNHVPNAWAKRGSGVTSTLSVFANAYNRRHSTPNGS